MARTSPTDPFGRPLVAKQAAPKRKASPEARGYGRAHRALRKLLQARIDRGGVRCARCGKEIPPFRPKAWDLGHDDKDRRRYNGAECRGCNRATAGRQVEPEPRRSRKW